MADRDDARPEFNPKHRIVGAIIIVALVVIFVPMILSERQPPSEVRSGGETGTRDEIANTKVVVTPVVVDEPAAVQGSQVAANTAPPPAEPTPKPETKPAAPAEPPAAAKQPSPAPAKEKTVKASTTTEKITKGWVVQVGTFSNTENSMRLRDKLKSHGHAVHTEMVTIAGKKAMRLRVGPFRDKEQAAKTQAQIHRETGVQGAVLTYP